MHFLQEQELARFSSKFLKYQDNGENSNYIFVYEFIIMNFNKI